MKQRIIYLIGVPTSGKSTWAKQFALKNPSFRILSRDAIREMLYGTYKMVYEDEKFITATLTYLKAMLLNSGLSIIEDNTNCKLGHLKTSLEEPLFKNFTKEFIDFPISREDFIKRNAKRNLETGKDIPIFVFDKMEEGRAEVIEYLLSNEKPVFLPENYSLENGDQKTNFNKLNYDEGPES